MQNNANLSEQDLMGDALTTEKQLINSYSTFLSEATCPNLRNELNKIITETQQLQFNLYNAMKQKGWYAAPNAQLQQVQQAVQKFDQMKQQLQ